MAVAGNASANDSDVRDVPSSAGNDMLFRMLTRGGLGKVNVSVEIDGMDSNLSEWSLGQDSIFLKWQKVTSPADEVVGTVAGRPQGLKGP